MMNLERYYHAQKNSPSTFNESPPSARLTRSVAASLFCRRGICRRVAVSPDPEAPQPPPKDWVLPLPLAPPHGCARPLSPPVLTPTMYYPSSPIAALAVRLILRRFPKVDYAYLRYQFRGRSLYTAADYAAMWAAWSETYPERATLRELLELLEDSSGRHYPLHDSDTALATSTPEPTSGLLRLSPPAKDNFHLIRFTMDDILAVDFVSGEIYVQKVN